MAFRNTQNTVLKFYSTIAINIYKRRISLKLTQDKLGELTGLGRQIIVNTETDRRRVGVYELVILAKFFNCELKDLLDE